MLRIVFLIDKLSLVVGASAATLVLPLGLIMTYEALARFLLNLPTFWAYELSYMITGAHFALGIALVTRNSEHIRIDFLYSRMPELCKEVIDFIVLFFCMTPLMIWTSVELVAYAWNTWLINEVSGESGWNPVVWPVKTAIAIGFSVFAIQLMAEVIKTGSRILSLIFGKKRS